MQLHELFHWALRYEKRKLQASSSYKKSKGLIGCAKLSTEESTL
jgi:hypothetical protein